MSEATSNSLGWTDDEKKKVEAILEHIDFDTEVARHVLMFLRDEGTSITDARMALATAFFATIKYQDWESVGEALKLSTR